MYSNSEIKRSPFRANHSTTDTREPSDKSDDSELIFSMVRESYNSLSEEDFKLAIIELFKLLGKKAHKAYLNNKTTESSNILNQLKELLKIYELPSEATGYLMLCQAQLTPNIKSFRTRSKLRLIATKNHDLNDLLARVYLLEGDSLFQQKIEEAEAKYWKCLEECDKALEDQRDSEDLGGVRASAHYKLAIINKIQKQQEKSKKHLQQCLRITERSVPDSQLVQQLKNLIKPKICKPKEKSNEAVSIQLYNGTVQTEDMTQADLSVTLNEDSMTLIISFDLRGLVRHNQTLEYSLLDHHPKAPISKFKLLGNDLGWLSYRNNQIYVDSHKIDRTLQASTFVSRRKAHKCTKPSKQSESGQDEKGHENNSSMDDFKTFLGKESLHRSRGHLST